MLHRTMILALTIGLCQVPAAFAANALESWKQEQMTSSSYLEKTGAMALNGLGRLAAAPFELVVHPYDEARSEGKGFSGIFEGLGIGIYHLGEDVVVGATNLITAPVPGYHGMHHLSRPK